MSLLTKIKVFFGAGILIVAGGLAYGIFDSNASNPFSSRFDDVELMLHVIYEPDIAKPVVAVQLSMTVPVIQSVGHSPWETPLKVPHATRVILSVVQGGRNHTECTILRRGNIMAHQELDGPGTISCQYLVA